MSVNALLDHVEKSSLKATPPQFAVGDTVDVATRIVEGDKERVQVFSGTVIMRKGRGVNETFTVRRIVNNEGVERLIRLADEWPRVAIGSSGAFDVSRPRPFLVRAREALAAICHHDGYPACKLHGLRMLNPVIFSVLPLASADSTNVARNIGIDAAWRRSTRHVRIFRGAAGTRSRAPRLKRRKRRRRGCPARAVCPVGAVREPPRHAIKIAAAG